MQGMKGIDTALTLEQVREAGRFAWCRSTQLFYVPGCGFFCAYESADELDGGLGTFDDIEAADETYLMSAGRGGWHHLPDCNCKFCGEMAEEAYRLGYR